MIHAQSAVCFDLDSTLRDSRQRHPHLPTVDPDTTWEQYSAMGADDVPMPGPVRAMQEFHRIHQVHIVSHSDKAASDITMAWLKRYVRFGWDFVALSADKVAYVQNLQAKGIEVLMFWEDWPPLARDITEKTGVPVVIINPVYPCRSCGFTLGDAEPAPEKAPSAS